VLTLELQPLPTDRVRGNELVNRISHRLPLRSMFLHPLAAESFLTDLAANVVVTDAFRSPEASLVALQDDTGSRPPGYSGHNYGLSIDVDIDAALADLRVDKPGFDRWMLARGWRCGRDDGERGIDDRHYDFVKIAERLGRSDLEGPVTDIEQLIALVHGDALMPDSKERQYLLRRLRFYGGVDDGIVGPLTREATAAFQRAWRLTDDAEIKPGVLDPRTRRTLAFVSHQRRLTFAP
jgi:hypothetical protein